MLIITPSTKTVDNISSMLESQFFKVQMALKTYITVLSYRHKNLKSMQLSQTFFKEETCKQQFVPVIILFLQITPRKA